MDDEGARTPIGQCPFRSVYDGRGGNVRTSGRIAGRHRALTPCPGRSNMPILNDEPSGTQDRRLDCNHFGFVSYQGGQAPPSEAEFRGWWPVQMDRLSVNQGCFYDSIINICVDFYRLRLGGVLRCMSSREGHPLP
jgi:hypothetical protein